MFSIEYKLKIGFKSHFTSKTLKIDFKLLEAEVLGNGELKSILSHVHRGPLRTDFK